MSETTITRRLAAILISDMFGYSRLMEVAEADTLARQKAHRKDLIDPEIARHRGRIVKTTGDGMLVEFPTAADSVVCAMAIQEAMREREREVDPERRILYRIGINVGDIVFDGDDIFGDGVNVAARLETLAVPGGVCVSDSVRQLVPKGLADGFVDMGSQRVKNIGRAIGVWQWSPEAGLEPQAKEPEIARTQRVNFQASFDGALLAWAGIGEGQPVLKAPNWFTHIEYEWRVPAWKAMFEEMARRCRLVRYDQRGTGLSDWDVDDVSQDAMLGDMKAIADAAGLQQFGLFSLSQGCAYSVRFAAENPERVKFLILYGGYARGMLKRGSPDQAAMANAFKTMIQQGWGSPLPTYRQVFTSMFMAGAPPDQTASFDELMRISASPETAMRIFDMNNENDVSALTSRVRAPTLVLHCRGDARVPFDEGRRLAAMIPDAQFVALEGDSHFLLPGTSAFDGFFEHIDRFLADLP